MSKVKIKGNASGTGVLTIEAPNTNTDSTITLPDGTGELIQADASGNVGIGVTPESWDSSITAGQIGNKTAIMNRDLGSSSDYVQFCHNAYYNSGDKYIESVGGASRLLMQDGVHKFAVAPSGTADSAITWTTAMTIDNSGRVGLGGGGSSPTAILHIQQNPSTISLMKLNNLKSGTTSTTSLQFLRNGTSVGTVSVTGSATSYNTSSDYRLKENVVPMTGSIDRLKELKPSRFNFKADADTTVDGFLAHEAGEVVPEAISGEKDGMRTEEYEVEPAVMDGETEVTPAVMGEREVEDYQGIDQSKLVPLLTSALQEAVAKIEDLEKRIEILEAN